MQRDPLKLFYFVYDKKDLPDDSLPLFSAAQPMPHLSLPSPPAYPTSRPSPSSNAGLDEVPEQRVKKKPGRKPGRKKKVPEERSEKESAKDEAKDDKNDMKNEKSEQVKKVGTEEGCKTDKEDAQKKNISTEKQNAQKETLVQDIANKTVQQDSGTTKKAYDQGLAEKTQSLEKQKAVQKKQQDSESKSSERESKLVCNDKNAACVQGSTSVQKSVTQPDKNNESVVKESKGDSAISKNTAKDTTSEKTDNNVFSKFGVDKMIFPSSEPTKAVTVPYPPKPTGVNFPQAAVTVPFGNVKATNVIFPSDLCARKEITQTYSRTPCYANPTPNTTMANVIKPNVAPIKPKKQKEFANHNIDVESRDVNNQLLPPGLQNAIRTKRPYNKKDEGEKKKAKPGRKPKAEGEKGEKRRPGRPRRAETVRSLLEKKAQQQRQQQPDSQSNTDPVKTVPAEPAVTKALVIPKVPIVTERPKVTGVSVTNTPAQKDAGASVAPKDVVNKPVMKQTIPKDSPNKMVSKPSLPKDSAVTKAPLSKDVVKKPVLHPKPVIANAVIEETPSTRVIIQNGVVRSSQPSNFKPYVPSSTPVNITPKNKSAVVKTTPQTVPLAANPPSRISPMDISPQNDNRDINREVTPPKSWSNGDNFSVSSPGSFSSASSPRSPASPDSGLSVRISGTPSPSQRSPGSSNGSSSGQRGRANKRESIDQIADILARKKAKITTKGSHNSSNGPIVNGDMPTGPKSVSNNNLTNAHSANTPQVTKHLSVSPPQTNNIHNGQSDYQTPAKGSPGVAGDSPLSSSPEDPADNIPLSLVAKGYDQPLELTTKKKPNGDIKRDSVPLKIPHLVKI